MPAPSIGPEIPLSSTGVQKFPTVAARADGTFAVAWYEANGADYKIQRFTAAGFLQASHLIETGASDLIENRIELLGPWSNGIVAIYVDTSQGQGDIFYEFYDPLNFSNSFDFPHRVNVSQEFYLQDNTDRQQQHPAAALDMDGSVLVSWVNTLSTGARDPDIAVFAPSGSMGSIGATFTSDVIQTELAAAISGNRRVVVGREEPSGNVIAHADGTQLVLGPGSNPHIARLADGGFAVAWQSSSGEVLFQVLNETGTSARTTAINVFPGGADLSQSHVCALSDGRFLVVWNDEDLAPAGFASANYVYGRLFNADGTPDSDAFIIDRTFDEGLLAFGAPRAAQLADGRIVVTYADGLASDPDIKAKIIDPRLEGITLAGTNLADDHIGSTFDDVFVEGAGNDQVAAGGGNDQAFGGAGNDGLFGEGGNDTLNGGRGNDGLGGGAGTDTAVFAGSRFAYTLTNFGGGNLRVVGPDGNDFVSTVERLAFNDATLNWPLANGNDFNADAFGDVLFRNTTNGQVASWELNGAGGFTFDNYGAAGLVWQEIAADDFNADGKGDVLFRNTGTGQVAVWELNGAGAFSFQSYGAASLAWNSVGAGDFNADGIGDVLYRNTSTGQVATWELNGVGGLAFDSYGIEDAAWKIAGIGDFNADGKDDILWRNSSTGGVKTWKLDGAGTFAEDSYGAASLAWHIYGVGDFNADGREDILWRNDSGQVQTWELDGVGGFASDSYGAANAQWSIMSASDTNSDGRDDVLWRNTANGQVAAWELNGAGGFSFQGYGAASLAWQVFDGNFEFV